MCIGYRNAIRVLIQCAREVSILDFDPEFTEKVGNLAEELSACLDKGDEQFEYKAPGDEVLNQLVDSWEGVEFPEAIRSTAWFQATEFKLQQASIVIYG